MPHAKEGDRVLLLSPSGKRFFIRLRPGQVFHTHKGTIAHDHMIGAPYGHAVVSHLGETFHMMRPSIYDELMAVKRASQIIYPKDLGQILLKLDLRSSRKVIEAGTGSGALTMALAHAVCPDGCVYSYEAREDMLRVARQNLERVGLDDVVEFIHRDIGQGFCHKAVDALFLDVREPWDYLDHALVALADGGAFGSLVPTTNQVSLLIEALYARPFTGVEVLEILIRRYKPVPARLRPADRMVGHTGYLVFARKIGSQGTDCD